MPAPRLFRRFTELFGLVDPVFEPKCNDAVRQVVEELEGLPEERGKATITVTMEIEYEKGLFNVLPGIKVKLPEGKKFRRTPLWSHDGAFTTQHPSQIDMFARAVPTETPNAASNG